MNAVLSSRQLFQSAWQTNNILRISAQDFSASASLPKPVRACEGDKTILYSYWHSSCSWRVRIALNWKNIPYETRAVNLLKPGGEQHVADYRMINPMAQVPTLLIGRCVGYNHIPENITDSQYALLLDGHSIIESIAILHYLEETRPLPALLPQDSYERARVREIVEIIASGVQPLQNLKVQKYVGRDKRKEWAQHWINSGFRALEERLSTSAGEYCVGDKVSMADCCLLPQVFNARK